MGHVRLGQLPRTRKWIQVVGLIRGGAGTAQVANATITAAERGLACAAKDRGVIETIWLLTQLPLAARAVDFAASLRACGVIVSNAPSLMEIVGAVTAAIDATMPNCKGRTDLGEMASGRKPASEAARAPALAGTYTQQLGRCRTQAEYTALCERIKADIAAKRLTNGDREALIAAARETAGRFPQEPAANGMNGSH